jgi:hypothetical protein
MDLGRNDQLGLGSGSSNRTMPVQVGGTDWQKISTKSSHTTAIKSDGTLWHWDKQAVVLLHYKFKHLYTSWYGH